MKTVDLLGVHVDAEHGVPVVLLQEHDAPHRVLPLFVGGAEAAAIALGVEGVHPPRPLSHDLMLSLVETLDASVARVEVTGLDDTTFLAALVLHGPDGDRWVDSRPSDAIALAVRAQVPLLVSDDVLERAGVLVEEEPGPVLDEAEVEAELDQFRNFLAELDPADFVASTEVAVDVRDPETAAPRSDAGTPAHETSVAASDVVSDSRSDADLPDVDLPQVDLADPAVAAGDADVKQDAPEAGDVADGG